MRRKLMIVAGIAASAVALYFTFSQVNQASFLASIESVEFGWLAVLPGLTLLSNYIAALRSQIVIRPLAQVSTWLIFKSLMITVVGNVLLPLRAGEFLRVDYLARQSGVSRTSILAVVGFERLLDFFFLFVMTFALMPLMTEAPSGAGFYSAAVIVAVGAGASLAIGRYPQAFVRLATNLSRPMGEKLSAIVSKHAERLSAGLVSLASWRAIVKVGVLSLLWWLNGLLFVQFTLWAFGFDLPAEGSALVLVLTSFGASIPSSPGFVGTYHYSASLALSMVGIDADPAAAFSVVSHAMSMLVPTLIALLILAPELLSGRFALRNIQTKKDDDGTK